MTKIGRIKIDCLEKEFGKECIIRNKNLKKLIKNNSLLYKKE